MPTALLSSVRVSLQCFEAGQGVGAVTSTRCRERRASPSCLEREPEGPQGHPVPSNAARRQQQKKKRPSEKTHALVKDAQRAGAQFGCPPCPPSLPPPKALRLAGLPAARTNPALSPLKGGLKGLHLLNIPRASAPECTGAPARSCFQGDRARGRRGQRQPGTRMGKRQRGPGCSPWGRGRG